jgi:hypothetical protein
MSDWKDEELRAAYAPLRKEAKAERGPDCPSPESERLKVLDHVFRCAACTREFALLRSVADPSSLAATTARRGFAGTIVRGLIAASVGAIAFLGVRRLVGPGEEPMRGGGGDFALVSPADGGEASASSTLFVWRSSPGALRYTLEVDAPDGTVAYTTETADTTASATFSLMQGEYRWWVLAKLNDGSEKRSEVRAVMLR